MYSVNVSYVCVTVKHCILHISSLVYYSWIGNLQNSTQFLIGFYIFHNIFFLLFFIRISHAIYYLFTYNVQPSRFLGVNPDLYCGQCERQRQRNNGNYNNIYISFMMCVCEKITKFFQFKLHSHTNAYIVYANNKYTQNKYFFFLISCKSVVQMII